MSYVNNEKAWYVGSVRGYKAMMVIKEGAGLFRAVNVREKNFK